MSNPLQIDLEVLQVYADASKLGVNIGVPAVCTRLPHQKKLTKVSITRMREGGFLSGSRNFKITDEGMDAINALNPPPVPVVETAPAVPVVRTGEQVRATLSETLAGQYLVSKEQLYRTIARNIISVGRNDPDPVTPEEVFIVMSICAQYDLNPMLKEIHAFRHKGKLQTPVGVDGWIKIANRDPNFVGVEYEFPEIKDMVKKGNKMVWPWVKATCHVKGKVPCVAYAFIDEWWTGDNWGAHPCHRLKQKAFTMVIREALGIALPDDEDAHQMMYSAQTQGAIKGNATTALLSTMTEALAAESLSPTPPGFNPPPIEEEVQPDTAVDARTTELLSTGFEGEANE